MLINRNPIIYLLILIVLINALGIFQPLLRNDDPILYANIAKHMLTSGNWINLISAGQDWLDKPHFPFWITAISFTIFGINSFAYILPGFIFHLIGAYYTYRLALRLYNKQCATLALTIYLTSTHLMLSALDVRAEAYLLGTIMPAIYYWLAYDRDGKWQSLLIGSLTTALALMTKGLFVIITIFSGMMFCWLINRQWRKFFAPKWLLAYGLCLIFITPELLSLYWQFDLHPEKLIFGQYNVSGIKWYFWGSQFGRFFNNGPIINKHGNPLFFVHTFLWAFLPWSIIFVSASYQQIRNLTKFELNLRNRHYFLLVSFWLTFILFSATKFQLDHYTNIIIPFAAIICANYLTNYPQHLPVILIIQRSLATLVLSLASLIILYFFHNSWWLVSLIIPLTCLLLSLKNWVWINFSYLEQCVWHSLLTMLGVIVLILEINGLVYAPYDVGYNLAKIINQQSLNAPVYDIDNSVTPTEFYVKLPYFHIHNQLELAKQTEYYLIISQQDWLNNSKELIKPHYLAIGEFCGNTIDKIIRNKIIHWGKSFNQSLICYKVLYHESKKL